jgi:hypothetical protein
MAPLRKMKLFMLRHLSKHFDCCLRIRLMLECELMPTWEQQIGKQSTMQHATKYYYVLEISVFLLFLRSSIKVEREEVSIGGWELWRSKPAAHATVSALPEASGSRQLPVLDLKAATWAWISAPLLLDDGLLGLRVAQDDGENHPTHKEAGQESTHSEWISDRLSLKRGKKWSFLERMYIHTYVPVLDVMYL